MREIKCLALVEREERSELSECALYVMNRGVIVLLKADVYSL